MVGMKLAAGSLLLAFVCATTTPMPAAAQGAPAPAAVVKALSAPGEGRRLFLKLNCYSCHGMAATGGMGPNIVHAERGDVAEALRERQDGGMRSFAAYVSDADITDIALYLRSIGTPDEPKFNNWWVAVPPR